MGGWPCASIERLEELPAAAMQMLRHVRRESDIISVEAVVLGLAGPCLLLALALIAKFPLTMRRLVWALLIIAGRPVRAVGTPVPCVLPVSAAVGHLNPPQSLRLLNNSIIPLYIVELYSYIMGKRLASGR